MSRTLLYFPTIEFEGKTLTQMEDAYSTLGQQGFTVYAAAAEDEEKNQYKVIWQTKPDYEDHDYVTDMEGNTHCHICGYNGCKFDNDEDCCDWDQYEVIKL